MLSTCDTRDLEHALNVCFQKSVDKLFNKINHPSARWARAASSGEQRPPVAGAAVR